MKLWIYRKLYNLCTSRCFVYLMPRERDAHGNKWLNYDNRYAIHCRHRVMDEIDFTYGKAGFGWEGMPEPEYHLMTKEEAVVGIIDALSRRDKGVDGMEIATYLQVLKDLRKGITTYWKTLPSNQESGEK